MTVITADMLAPRAEPKRDRYGRYLIPDPETGKERAWTRATTLADTLDDRYNLELWKLRTAAVGLAQRKDLLALVAAHRNDKRQLDRVCADALEAGKASEGANLGTALHALTEQLDRGEDVLVLDELRGDIEAYRETMTASGLRIATLPDGRLAREVIVLCPELGVAGTADHIFESDPWLIGDLKTGASAIEWAMTSISIQLSIYAHATHWFDPVTGVLAELTARDTSRALVIHLPVGKASCTLHEVDIAAGWEAAQHALWVRGWRKRKNLATPRATVTVEKPASDTDPFASFAHDRSHDGEPVRDRTSPRVVSPPAPPAGAPLPRVEWIAQRIAALPESAVALLQTRWNPNVAPPRKMREAGLDYDDNEVAWLDEILVPLEREHEAPFSPDPLRPEPSGWVSRDVEAARNGGAGASSELPTGGTRLSPLDDAVERGEAPAPDEGPAVSDDDVNAMQASFNKLSGNAGLQAKAWLAEMAEAGRPIALAANRTRRRWSIARAVHAFASYDDEILRAALAIVLGDEVQESITTGAALAALTIDEADRLADVGRALDASTLVVSYGDDGVCRIAAA